MNFILTILASLALALATTMQAEAVALSQSVRFNTLRPCPNRCLPAWIAFNECLAMLDGCILRGCQAEGAFGQGPFAICTEDQPLPTPTPSPVPSPAPTGCTTGSTDHRPGEFGVQCTCPNLGVTFISIANPPDVLTCMRSCYQNSGDFLEACHEYKRKNINGDLSEIRPVFLEVGRICCETYCGGFYTSSIGKPTCSRN
eukprot:gb/GEZJ01006430.1/.p1 GENE.gb/GEZJ01006430.1/~~gb/GEZJ01006430.1/.p1  ORF type:complete len:200 (-),score=4.93 gb/GEZJ01006430.1/:202-801(-)